MTGVGQIYANSGVPCIPVALNSGLFWPRRTFMRYPGTLVVEFLDPLPPGLNRKDFVARIATSIEDATNRLVEAARQEQAQLFGRVPNAPDEGGGVECSLPLSPCGRVDVRSPLRTGEGSVSADRDPSSGADFVRATFSHKGRREDVTDAAACRHAASAPADAVADRESLAPRSI